MTHRNVLILSLLLVTATVLVVGFADQQPRCVYTFYIETGPIENAGTDSIISVTITNKSGQNIVIKDIVKWGGLMGPGYDYFERGNLDIFSGVERCLPSPICSLTLSSDGSGVYPGWYVNYVDVTTVSAYAISAHHYFDVEQWLSTDTNLTTVRNDCSFSHTERIISGVGSKIRKSLF